MLQPFFMCLTDYGQAGQQSAAFPASPHGRPSCTITSLHHGRKGALKGLLSPAGRLARAVWSPCPRPRLITSHNKLGTAAAFGTVPHGCESKLKRHLHSLPPHPATSFLVALNSDRVKGGLAEMLERVGVGLAVGWRCCVPILLKGWTLERRCFLHSAKLSSGEPV